jgi:S-sulfo-L-cysteine synthase (3-phospho-L-serine-dependent)
MEPKRLLVLGAGPAQLSMLETARRRGLTVVAADRDPSAPGFSKADRRAIVSIEDEPAIERLAGAEAVSGLVASGTDHAVALAARVAARLGLPHPLTPEAALLATSKRRQRERLAEAGVPQPRSIVCRSLDDVVAAAEELGFPCVIEAPDRSGERGVALAEDRRAVARAAVDAVAESRNDYCLVEELVGGRIVTLTGFVLDGALVPLTVTDREQAPAPAFGVPLAHLWPATLRPPDADSVGRVVAAAAAALDVHSGPVTAQVLLAPSGPLLAKLSARTGGGHDSELCRIGLGVDLDDLAIAAALGEPVDAESLRPSAASGGACVRFLVAPPGELVETRGVEAARAVPGVRLVRLYRPPGHRFSELRRASDRAGAVLAAGASPEEAQAVAGEAAALVEFVVSRQAGALA